MFPRATHDAGVLTSNPEWPSGSCLWKSTWVCTELCVPTEGGGLFLCAHIRIWVRREGGGLGARAGSPLPCSGAFLVVNEIVFFLGWEVRTYFM